jgi:pyruvate,water dikinase
MGQLIYQLASYEEIKKIKSVEEFENRIFQRKMGPSFLETWDQFIKLFGFRCPREIDVATPRPNEHPGLLFEQLRNMSMVSETRKGSKTIFEEARAKRESAYQFLKKIAYEKGPGAGKTFKVSYRVLLALGGYGKENSKHYIVMVMDAFRKKVLRTAQMLAETGRLDYPEQIFDLKIEDIDRGLTDPSFDLPATAKKRTELWKKINQSHHLVRVIDSRGRIFNSAPKKARDGELIGVPISPGIVQGKVRVVHEVNGNKLLPGEILVARATDPGWTPLFINAKGIILEIGGALQHGAIIAREYGIPCVSGLDDATSLLTDGQLVEVDGSNGIVRILE